MCDALRNFIPFVQCKKREKHPWRKVNFSKVAGFASHLFFSVFWIDIYLFHDGGRYHIETSPLIYSANQWTGFYMISTSVMEELTHFMPLVYFNTTWKYHWSISENLLTFTCSKSTINNRNTRKRCEICSKSTIETPERRQWRKGKEIVNFFPFPIHCVKSV